MGKKKEPMKGEVGQLWGVKVLPETPEEWAELMEKEKAEAVKAFAEQEKG